MSSNHLLQDVVIQNEQQLKQLEELLYNNGSPEKLTQAICSHLNVRQVLKHLSQKDKKLDAYQKLVFRDTLLSIKSMEFGSIKYFG